VVVVAFYPDPGFEGRLQEVLGQVGGMVVIDNTPSAGRKRTLMMTSDDSKQLHVVENEVNLGLGTALNQGLEYALRQGFEWILTLDQDTTCQRDMVQTLIQAYAACHPRPAVIGTNYFDPVNNNRTKVPVISTEAFLERKTVITSGCLVDAAFARAIGGFREDYFIDQLDHEFCLRARFHGGLVVISRKPGMAHNVGGPDGSRVPIIGLVLPEHPPLRKYYIARNTVVLVSDYFNREPAWCLLRIMRLLLGAVSMTLLEKDGLRKLQAFTLGVADGVRRRMGPCRRKWLHT
jgi:rhamnosyltransferase